MKFYSKKYVEKYEKRFNAYILILIEKTYKNYLKQLTKNNTISLNEVINNTERIENIEGENDVNFEERIVISNLENLMTNLPIYNAIKKINYKKKLVIYLRIILGKNSDEVARLMGYKAKYSCNRLLKNAIKEIKDNLRDG